MIREWLKWVMVWCQKNSETLRVHDSSSSRSPQYSRDTVRNWNKSIDIPANHNTPDSSHLNVIVQMSHLLSFVSRWNSFVSRSSDHGQRSNDHWRKSLLKRSFLLTYFARSISIEVVSPKSSTRTFVGKIFILHSDVPIWSFHDWAESTFLQTASITIAVHEEEINTWCFVHRSSFNDRWQNLKSNSWCSHSSYRVYDDGQKFHNTSCFPLRTRASILTKAILEFRDQSVHLLDVVPWVVTDTKCT